MEPKEEIITVKMDDHDQLKAAGLAFVACLLATLCALWLSKHW